MMEALKYMSPTAAQATGAPQPNYAGIDVTAGLNQGNYRFGGAPPAPAAPVAPGGPVIQPIPNATLTPPQLQPIPNATVTPPMAQMAGNPYKPGWPQSDPRLTDRLNPYLYDPNAMFDNSVYSPGF